MIGLLLSLWSISSPENIKENIAVIVVMIYLLRQMAAQYKSINTNYNRSVQWKLWQRRVGNPNSSRPTSPVSLTIAKQYIGAYTVPAHKNPDKIRISGFGVKKVAENPDLPKWNGYAMHCKVQTLTPPLHRTAFTDTGLLNGFLFSFSINLFVWFVQWTKLTSSSFLIAR